MTFFTRARRRTWSSLAGPAAFGASLITAALILGACATTQTIATDDRTRSYSHDFDTVYGAVLQAVVDEGYVVKTTDKDAGLVDTDYLHRSGLTLKGKQRRKVNALVRLDGGMTRVTLTIAVEQPNDEGDWQSLPLTEKAALRYYDGLFNRIAENL